MLLAITLAFSLVALSFTFHYWVLIWLSVSSQIKMDKQGRVLFIVFVLFLAHIVEIGFYAFIYNLSVTTLDLGFFNGTPIGGAMNYLYYSGVIFTTLGLGDIHPVGHIRFITAIEALNGFFLITWSASFTFLAMGQLWPWGSQCVTSADKGGKAIKIECFKRDAND